MFFLRHITLVLLTLYSTISKRENEVKYISKELDLKISAILPLHGINWDSILKITPFPEAIHWLAKVKIKLTRLKDATSVPWWFLSLSAYFLLNNLLASHLHIPLSLNAGKSQIAGIYSRRANGIVRVESSQQCPKQKVQQCLSDNWTVQHYKVVVTNYLI